MEALYPLAYTLKFIAKARTGQDYIVPPLEGLWWADDMSAFESPGRKDEWKWTLMIMQPDFISIDWLEEARERRFKRF